MLALSAAHLDAHAGPAQDCARAELAYIGTDAGRIQALRLDACDGRLTAIGPVAEASKPRWSAAYPLLSMLYVASDVPGKDGAVIAYKVNRKSGGLTPVNELGAGGAGTTHLWLDATSRTLLAANFDSGSASSMELKPDGSLGSLVSTIKSTGSGPHRRQAGPHAHGVIVDPSGRYALVPDLGADRVFVYALDRATHALSPDDPSHPRSFTIAPGSGPHHVAFGADGHFLYLLNELSADVTTLRWDARQGRLTLVQSLPISSPDFQGAKSGGEIALGPDGRFVYVANRGESALVVYRVDAKSGALSPVQRLPSGGERPWTFAIHPSGKWMLVANARSNKVNLFRIDPMSGLLTDTGQSAAATSPLSITFMN